MFDFKLYFDIPLLLTTLTLLTGVLALADLLFLASKRKISRREIPVVFDYARSFFPVFLLVLVIRSFLVQPYRVPTGSLEPTILPGDFILVNQYTYGLRLPVINYKLINIGSPQRGDIVLFRYPIDPSTIFVKRVVGLPGDQIVYRNKELIINGQLAEQQYVGPGLEAGSGFYSSVQLKTEDLVGVTHEIFINPRRHDPTDIELVVPPDNYFVMGDNRDNSNDSREWGLVPEQNLVGKAVGIWMSWDKHNKTVRWDRIGRRLR